MSTLVSVIVPTYNRADLLENAVRSIKEQTYKQIEIIVIDDCSSDNTMEVMKKLAKENSNIKYIRNRSNKGAAYSRNRGILRSKGGFVAFLDSDDQWQKQHVEKSIEVLEKENAYVCSSFWYEKDSEGRITEYYPTHRLEEAIRELSPDIRNGHYVFSNEFFQHTIKTGFYCYGMSTLIVDSRVFAEVGYFDPGLKTSEDMDFCSRLFAKYGLCLIDGFYSTYCSGDDNLYNFINRRNLKPDDILKSKDMIEKLAYCNYYKCKMLIKRREAIKNSKFIEDKEYYLRLNDEQIARKFFAIAYIYQKENKLKSLYYAWRAWFLVKCNDHMQLIKSILCFRKYSVEWVDFY